MSLTQDLPSKHKLCSESMGDIETKTLHRRHGRLIETHDQRRGVLHFRPLCEATFMHLRPEELACKRNRDAEFLEEVQPVDDLRLNTRNPTLRQHKRVCHLAMETKHKTSHQRVNHMFWLDTKSWLAELSDECKDQGS